MREAVQALARRGLTVAQASAELGYTSRAGAHYHGKGLFQGGLMTGAREWLEGMPPREAVEAACDLIDALCTPPSPVDPLRPWDGLVLHNMRYARLLAYLHRASLSPEPWRAVHADRLRAVVFQDIIDWQASDWQSVWYYCDRLDRALRFEPCHTNTAKADLKPLARPWGRIVWGDKKARLEMSPGVPEPWRRT